MGKTVLSGSSDEILSQSLELSNKIFNQNRYQEYSWWRFLNLSVLFYGTRISLWNFAQTKQT